MNAAPNPTVPTQPRRGDDSPPSVQYAALLTRLERGQSTAGDADGDGRHAGVPRWFGRLLRATLPAKLFGANMLLLVTTAATALIVRQRQIGTAPVLAVIIVAFLAALLLNAALVMLAVRPLRVLEKTVDTIWQGDLDARVPTSVLADRHVMRVSRMFNILLDGLVADRARARRLAAEIIGAADRERAAISRELHDSAAQSLAALVMQLSVGVRSADDAPSEVLKEHIETARTLAIATLEEVRLLAHTMHPRVLDDLGLIPALRRLARETTEHLASQPASPDAPAFAVSVVAEEGSDAAIPAPVMSVLYRVAQEAVQNARRHASADRVEITFQRNGEEVSIEITDDGRGFDPEATRDDRAHLGLFTMRERVALVDGELHVRSDLRAGTSVRASIPLQPASNNSISGLHT